VAAGGATGTDGAETVCIPYIVVAGADGGGVGGGGVWVGAALTVGDVIPTTGPFAAALADL